MICVVPTEIRIRACAVPLVRPSTEVTIFSFNLSHLVYISYPLGISFHPLYFFLLFYLLSRGSNGFFFLFL